MVHIATKYRACQPLHACILCYVVNRKQAHKTPLTNFYSSFYLSLIIYDIGIKEMAGTSVHVGGLHLYKIHILIYPTELF